MLDEYPPGIRSIGKTTRGGNGPHHCKASGKWVCSWFSDLTQYIKWPVVGDFNTDVWLPNIPVAQTSSDFLSQLWHRFAYRNYVAD